MQISVQRTQVKEGRRSLDDSHVKELADSIRELGLLNPITVDQRNTLIAGLHRLEAVKMLGWAEVECIVSSLEGLQAELAEIDENIVRCDLSALEYGETLLRRKEIYEMLHPETKQGGDRKSEEIKTTKCRFDPVKSFTQDTAEKLGVAKRTVERQLRTAKNLTPEAKEIIKKADTKFSKRAAMELSRLEPEQQKEAAVLFAAKEIKTVNEYKARKAPDEEEQRPEISGKAVRGKSGGSAQFKKSDNINVRGTKEIVAELKDPDKDCSGTPDSFLDEYGAFVRKFHKEISWYGTPYYDVVFSLVTPEHITRLRELTDSICSAAEKLFHKVESKGAL